ncbi:hypothetical protein SAMN02745135_02585 [Caloranaerobacter azorensis DSM 13643]|uniref:Uncharacterized protein n=1 Tax=Caloranaerobacter azorensis DSM 13643 TaxID=1121264 RepID=A0A1M5WR33_9FIRM|nr:hypothetical protein [Caloranaerobacter azorensis]SHH89473.1 hypothetical protein SAMN02745135_02585 [Caloranaerobacter azorensis DSM 13643]
MRLNKILVLTSIITLILIIIVLHYFRNDNGIESINILTISRIQMQKGIDGIPITIENRAEIERLISKLDTDKWELVKCKYQSYPNYFIFIYNDRRKIELGFFTAKENVYCKFIINKKNICYKVPLNSYKLIKEYLE